MKKLIAGALIGATLTAGGTAAAGGYQAMHDHASYHHRATHTYVGPACEEDEVLWWVADGVRSCQPINDIDRS